MKLSMPSLLFAALVSSSLCLDLSGQTTTSGGLSGVVTDQSDALITDANVVIEDHAKGMMQSTKTDQTGVYRFFFLPPGKFTVSVTHPGFREESRSVDLPIGPSVTANFNGFYGC